MASPAGNPISLEQWKALARQGETPVESVLHKQYVADSIKSDGDRSYTFTISTGAIDRDRDTLAVDGWRVNNFLKAGGPVLWAHQSLDLPIGKASWVRVQGGVLKARVEFAPEEVYPFAETVRRLVEFGALKSTSVGFIPDFEKAKYNEERGGFDFKGQELLEFSIVPVPSNPEALMEAKAAGIDLDPLREWAKGILEPPPPLAFDATPYVKVVREAFEKRGRVLSQANHDRIVRARDGAEACMAALDEVMSSMPMEDMDPKAAPIAYVVPQPKYLVDPAALASAVTNAVSRSASERLNYLRGRID